MEIQGHVVEIFKSFQGEGKYVGMPQIFLRLGLCNLQCAYCDTDFKKTVPMTSQAVLGAVENLLDGDERVRSLSVTGGEPLVQEEFLRDLLPRIKAKGLSILLETNGTLPEKLAPLLPWIDTVAMDIKLPSMAAVGDFWKQHREFLEICRARDTYVKVVVSGGISDREFQQAVDLVGSVDPSLCIILQPVTVCGVVHPPSQQTLEQWAAMAADVLMDVRVIPQMHKRWEIP